MNWDNSLSTSASIAIQRTLCVCWKVKWTIWWKTTSGEDTKKMSQGFWHWSGYKKLHLNNQTMEDLSLPVPDFQLINQHIQEQLSETDENTRQEKRLMGEMMAAQFNEGQRSVFDQVMASTNDVNNILPWLYFLDGPGGTGKSFLNNSIITVLQGQRKNVIAVASTRIASTLLIGSATYHSAFKLYPPITETTRSRIEAGSYAAELIRRAISSFRTKQQWSWILLSTQSTNCFKQRWRKVAKFSFLAAISDSACPLLKTETGFLSLKPPSSTTGLGLSQRIAISHRYCFTLGATEANRYFKKTNQPFVTILNVEKYRKLEFWFHCDVKNCHRPVWNLDKNKQKRNRCCCIWSINRLVFPHWIGLSTAFEFPSKLREFSTTGLTFGIWQQVYTSENYWHIQQDIAFFPDGSAVAVLNEANSIQKKTTQVEFSLTCWKHSGNFITWEQHVNCPWQIASFSGVYEADT